MYNVYFNYLIKQPKKLLLFFLYSIAPLVILYHFSEVSSKMIIVVGIWGMMITSSALLVEEIINLEDKSAVYKRVMVNHSINYLLNKKILFVCISVTGYVGLLLLGLFGVGEQFGIKITSNEELLSVFARLAYALLFMCLQIHFLVITSFIVRRRLLKNFMRVVSNMLLLLALVVNNWLIYVLVFLVGLCVNIILAQILKRFSAETFIRIREGVL
ncbi:MAG: hypothetical protein COA82_09160 [Alkaliphilus sp.]|nr:MAG: hypothetical protein COA82_09160 [Alkaliphilus sp.]